GTRHGRSSTHRPGRGHPRLGRGAGGDDRAAPAARRGRPPDGGGVRRADGAGARGAHTRGAARAADRPAARGAAAPRAAAPGRGGWGPPRVPAGLALLFVVLAAAVLVGGFTHHGFFPLFPLLFWGFLLLRLARRA